jgi:hypothetical protein
MYDYTYIGDIVHTPCGYGRYLDHKNGKVLVMFDFDCQPVEFDGDVVRLSAWLTDDLYCVVRRRKVYEKGNN